MDITTGPDSARQTERVADTPASGFFKSWQAIALQLVTRGTSNDYAILAAGFDHLLPLTRYKVINEVYSTANRPHAESYFHLAARALSIWEPEAEYQHAIERYRFAASAVESAAPFNENNTDVFTRLNKPAPTDTPWHREWQFVSQCLKMLDSAPEEFILAMASSPEYNLLEHDILGVHIGFKVSEYKFDFELPAHLKDLFTRTGRLGTKKNVIAAARKDASLPSRDLLEDILRKNTPPWDEKTPLSATERKEVLNAASRALGGMGAGNILQRIAGARLDRADSVDYEEVALASIKGMAYIPPEHEPIERLLDIMYATSLTLIQQACAETILTHLELGQE